MPSAIAHHRLATSAPTAGVKYRPSAVPITHCPPLRSGAQLSVGAPSTDTSEVASSGPIIQGIGVRSQTQSSAATSASNRVRKTRGHEDGPKAGKEGTRVLV